MKEKKILYFELPGKQNTNTALELAKERANKLKINNVILASTSGLTAEKAFETFKATTLIIVGIERERFSSELIKNLESEGIQIRFSREVKYKYPDLAKTVLRRFCEGMKVAIQITLIAADEGLIPLDREVIAIAGTTHEGKQPGGSDTAIVVKPSTSARFYELKVREIICKPR
jgi:hypothetical protein